MIRWMKDYVAVKVIHQTESKGGIIFPQNSNEPMKGEVTGVGDKVKEFKTGDKILFPRHVGQKMNRDGEELLILSDYHILGFI